MERHTKNSDKNNFKKYYYNKERFEKLGLTTLPERRIRDLNETFKIINGISN